MTKKKSTQKPQTETIIITPSYFDLMASEEVQAFRKKVLPPRFSLDLARATKKVLDEARIYFDERNKIISEHKINELTKEIEDEKAEDVLKDKQKILEGKKETCNKELLEISDKEFDLKMDKIKIPTKDFNRLPDLSEMEWQFLLPLIAQEIEE